MSCNKTKYMRQREANEAIAYIKKHSSESIIPKRSYYCTECKCFHITSSKVQTKRKQ